MFTLSTLITIFLISTFISIPIMEIKFKEEIRLAIAREQFFLRLSYIVIPGMLLYLLNIL